MLLSCKICVLLVILSQAVAAFAQENIFSSPAAAISELFPNKKVSEWISTEGDLNADGIKDLAMILVYFPEDRPFETRLVILAGAPGGKYLPLSISSRYCDAQKFFNLEAKGASLFVQEVHKADGDSVITNTLQFRFNKKLSDLELIGTENISESFDDKSYHRSSVNYPAGMVIEYERTRGRIKETKRSHFMTPRLARLNGFDCDKYFYGTPQ